MKEEGLKYETGNVTTATGDRIRKEQAKSSFSRRGENAFFGLGGCTNGPSLDRQSDLWQ